MKLFTLIIVFIFAPIIVFSQTDDHLVKMIFVEGGEYQTGVSISDDTGLPTGGFKATVQSYYIGIYEITQDQWFKVIPESSPDVYEGSSLPVGNISWYSMLEFCNKLSLIENLTPVYTILDDKVIFNKEANGYRLPTLWEWEYAAIGGKFTQKYKYFGSNTCSDVSWTSENSGGVLHKVGEKAPNELGIYDMGGNVAELVWDWDESRSLKKNYQIE